MRTIAGVVMLAVFIPLPGAGQDNKVTTRNQEVIRQNLDRINRGDVVAAASDWADDAQNFGRPVGRAGVQRTLEDIITVFPDYRMEIVEMVAVGDVVVVRCNVTGTHRGVAKTSANGGMLLGVQPTGKRHEIAHIHWYTLRNEKIVEHYATRDDLGMMRQLGLLPTKAP